MANGKTNQDEINAVAWKACDTFRGVVDPSEYKNYILVFLFLKYLSDLWKDKKEQYEKTSTRARSYYRLPFLGRIFFCNERCPETDKPGFFMRH